MKFTKMHGCGNDYVYVNCFQENVADPKQVAQYVSKRHFGIGSDGLILICPSTKADFAMKMYNADGSEGAMCGNGIRCIGKYVYEHGMTKKKEITIETKAGIKVLKLHVNKNQVWKVTVDMGIPELETERIPVLYEKKQIIQEPITIDENVFFITCVSMGNPHAVLFVPDVEQVDIEQLGPKLEHHFIFPNRANIEFVQVIDPTHIKMRVWERGSGETLACGTGACASVVAGRVNKLLFQEVSVQLLGGNLEVLYEEEQNKVYLTGSATSVFEGEISL